MRCCVLCFLSKCDHVGMCVGGCRLVIVLELWSCSVEEWLRLWQGFLVAQSA